MDLLVYLALGEMAKMGGVIMILIQNGRQTSFLMKYGLRLMKVQNLERILWVKIYLAKILEYKIVHIKITGFINNVRMKKNNLLILGVILFAICACDPFDTRLKFYNQTNRKFVFSAGLDFKIDSLSSFDNFQNGFLYAFDSTYYLASVWEYEFRDSKTKELTLIFLYADSINAYKKRYDTLSVFFKHNKNYKIRKFTQAQLDSCSWKINVSDDDVWNPENYWTK
jgi:hypothetical protein